MSTQADKDRAARKMIEKAERLARERGGSSDKAGRDMADRVRKIQRKQGD